MSLRILDLSELKFQEGQQPEILLESYSDTVRTVQVRGFTKWGTFSFDHVTLGTRGIKSESFRLPGIPIALTATTTSTSVTRGRLYLRIKLRLAGFPVLDLTAAYLTDTKELSWPPGIFESSIEGSGFIRIIIGTDPAANVQISETVPTGARWLLRGFRATLATDANVANRRARVEFDDGVTVYAIFPAGADAIASASWIYSWAIGGIQMSAFDANNKLLCPLAEIRLAAGHRIQSTTGSMQANDNWQAPVLVVEEFLDP